MPYHFETFDYAGPYSTLEKAQDALIDCYATGEVVEGERPCIEKRRRLTGLHSQVQSCYWITLTYCVG